MVEGDDSSVSGYTIFDTASAAGADMMDAARIATGSIPKLTYIPLDELCRRRRINQPPLSATIVMMVIIYPS